jgi:hypothetical protein
MAKLAENPPMKEWSSCSLVAFLEMFEVALAVLFKISISPLLVLFVLLFAEVLVDVALLIS